MPPCVASCCRLVFLACFVLRRSCSASHWVSHPLSSDLMTTCVRVFMVTDDGIPGQRRRLENIFLISRCAPTLRHHLRCGAHTVWMRLWLVSWQFFADTSQSVSTPSRTIVFHVKIVSVQHGWKKHPHDIVTTNIILRLLAPNLCTQPAGRVRSLGTWDANQKIKHDSVTANIVLRFLAPKLCTQPTASVRSLGI